MAYNTNCFHKLGLLVHRENTQEIKKHKI